MLTMTTLVSRTAEVCSGGQGDMQVLAEFRLAAVQPTSAVTGEASEGQRLHYALLMLPSRVNGYALLMLTLATRSSSSPT